ncbi:putative glycolipid-binding domain-containing protein [Gallaecimonas sp. GXIMD4217]|uniref:putative glycolipid-binding domain-containing protein n=1 Tax=Gallaecimonas sp. GXIMD4217 TaxID=3131927 RepID=UPI00311ADE80
MITRHWSGPWQSRERVELHECQLRGEVAGQLDGEAFTLSYQIRCDPKWRTREVRIERQGGDTLVMEVDRRGHWHANGRRLVALDGCLDVDLGFTPATNLLPLRRCPLEVGETMMVSAAWLPFPDWRWQPMVQRYTRLGQDRYRYQNEDSGYTADLIVDEHGLVLSYGDVWATAP